MALTSEQQRALDELFDVGRDVGQPVRSPNAELGQVPGKQTDPLSTATSNGKVGSHSIRLTPGEALPGPAGTYADLLQTWLGVSSGDVKGKLMEWLAAKDRVERQVLDMVERNPLDSAMTFIAAASVAFYAAEKGVNPKIGTYVDAFYYIGTCASVGYADIFAATQTGRAIAALVMIVGPALAAHVLDRPASTTK
jgi:hypothetical protein